MRNSKRAIETGGFQPLRARAAIVHRSLADSTVCVSLLVSGPLNISDSASDARNTQAFGKRFYKELPQVAMAVP